MIPGVRRLQTGETEMRALFPPEALEQVAGVIRARRRRTGRKPSEAFLAAREALNTSRRKVKGDLLSRTKEGIRYEPSLPYFKIAFDWGLV